MKENPSLESQDEPAEFEFHQERIRKSAEKRSKRLINRLLGKKTSETEIAYEEALRENTDFERRKHEEFEEWEKHLKVVLDHLKARRDDPEGEGKKYKILLLILGGGMRGPYSVAQTIALNEAGLDSTKFYIVVGISAGAGTASVYVAGKEQTHKGASIYYEECTTKEFLNLLRLTQIMNARVVGRALREGSKKLDQRAILESPTNFYVAVTRQTNKQAELINVKTAKPDMVSAIEASMNVPLISAPGIEVNDVSYIDGGFDPLPLQEVIDEFHPTDILVLPNVPFDRLETFKAGWGEWFLSSNLINRIVPYSGMPGTIVKFLKGARELRNLLEEFKEKRGVDIGIFWPPDQGLKNTSAEPDTIKAAIYETVRVTLKELGIRQPKKIPLYESEKTT